MHNPIYVHNVFLVLAFVFFMLDGIRVNSPKVSWTPLGFACVVAAILWPYLM
jgi:hypothetical protein